MTTGIHFKDRPSNPYYYVVAILDILEKQSGDYSQCSTFSEKTYVLRKFNK